MCYVNSTPHYRLVGYVHDKPADLSLRLYVDADFSGDSYDTKSTSGGYLVLYGEKSFFPLMWLSQRQMSTSRSTTEADVVSLAKSLFSAGIPVLDLWDLLLDRQMHLNIMEGNQATMKVVRKGYSPKLRHIQRTHKVDLGSIKEVIGREPVELKYVKTDLQAADIFTKALAPIKWPAACLALKLSR